MASVHCYMVNFMLVQKISNYCILVNVQTIGDCLLYY